MQIAPLKKVCTSFILNWCYWLTVRIILKEFVFDEERSWQYHLIHATCMSFFMTVFSNWKTVKAIFKKESRQIIDSTSDF